MAVWAGDGTFLALLRSDPEVTAHLTPEALDSCFDLAYHTKHVGEIFARVFGGDVA